MSAGTDEFDGADLPGSPQREPSSSRALRSRTAAGPTERPEAAPPQSEGGAPATSGLAQYRRTRASGVQNAERASSPGNAAADGTGDPSAAAPLLSRYRSRKPDAAAINVPEDAAGSTERSGEALLQSDRSAPVTSHLAEYRQTRASGAQNRQRESSPADTAADATGDSSAAAPLLSSYRSRKPAAAVAATFDLPEFDPIDQTVQSLRSELVKVRNKIFLTEIELDEARESTAESISVLRALETSLSYRLGALVLGSRKSLRNWVRFPFDIFGVVATSLRQRRGPAAGVAPGRPAALRPAIHLRWAEATLEVKRASGTVSAAEWARSKSLPDDLLARALLDLAFSTLATDPYAALGLAKEAGALGSTDERLKRIAFDLFDLGEIAGADQLLTAIAASEMPFNAAESRKASVVRTAAS